MKYTYYTSESTAAYAITAFSKSCITLTRRASYRAAVEAAKQQALEQRRDIYHAMYVLRADRDGFVEELGAATSDGKVAQFVRVATCQCGNVENYRVYNAR